MTNTTTTATVRLETNELYEKYGLVGSKSWVVFMERHGLYGKASLLEETALEAQNRGVESDWSEDHLLERVIVDLVVPKLDQRVETKPAPGGWSIPVVVDKVDGVKVHVFDPKEKWVTLTPKFVNVPEKDILRIVRELLFPQHTIEEGVEYPMCGECGRRPHGLEWTGTAIPTGSSELCCFCEKELEDGGGWYMLPVDQGEAKT